MTVATFKPANGISKVELAYQELRSKPTGEVIPYADLPYEGKVSQAKIRKLLEREQQRSLDTAREVIDGRSVCVGWVIVAGVAQTAIVRRDRRRALRMQDRALHTAQNQDRREMNGEERRDADAELIRVNSGKESLLYAGRRRLGMEDIKAWNAAHRRD